MVKTHILRIVEEIESVSLKKRAKKGGVIKQKMSVLGKQETLLLYTIGENHHFKQIQSCFVIAVAPPFFIPPLI